MTTFFNAWFEFFTSIWWVRDLAVIAVFWIVLQLLPNRWAGGKLFDRAYAWISTTVAAILAFIVFVLPNLSWPLIIGLVVVGVLLLVAFSLRSKNSDS